MKQTALIAGVGMTSIGRHMDRTLSSLAEEAVLRAVDDARVPLHGIQAAWVGTVGAPMITGQVCIVGQIVTRRLGIGGIPIVNVENACATGSTAFQQACSMVSLGACDVALALGVEKMHHPDRQRTLLVLRGGADVDAPAEILSFLGEESKACSAVGDRRSLFMRIYARWAQDYMARSGATVRDFAKVVVKASQYAHHNPAAQVKAVVDEADVLDAPLIAVPLTRLMCSPIADGAAAIIVVSPAAARRLGVSRPVRVLASLIASGADAPTPNPGVSEAAAIEVYKEAGASPGDLDCAELHDASAPAEMMLYEDLSLCAKGEGPGLIRDGATAIGGRIPVNTSGGLLRKGHPLAATGIAQLHELVHQLRSRADKRQVPGARLALAHNAGGFLRGDAATVTLTVLARSTRRPRAAFRAAEGH